MRIAFLIRALVPHGAERQLALLACGLAARGHSVCVIVFYGTSTPLSRALQDAGIEIVDLRKRGRWDNFAVAYRMWRFLREFNPDVLHSYLVVPNVISALLRALIPRAAIVWGIRGSDIDLSRYDWTAESTFRISCWLARYPDLVISNSQAGYTYHIAAGYPRDSLVVIPNGIDTAYFQRDDVGGSRLRQTWGFRSDDIVIGLIGRLDTVKGHKLFIEAARMLTGRFDEVSYKFVFVGDAATPLKSTIDSLIQKSNLTDHVFWAGVRHDLPQVYSALNLTVLASSSEGFPNVVAESMACGTPVVATDVGDTSLIVERFGVVVPPHDPGRLAAACECVLSQARLIDREALRKRIVENYSLDRMVSSTESALQTLIAQRDLSLAARRTPPLA